MVPQVIGLEDMSLSWLFNRLSSNSTLHDTNPKLSLMASSVRDSKTYRGMSSMSQNSINLTELLGKSEYQSKSSGAHVSMVLEIIHYRCLPSMLRKAQSLRRLL